MGTYTKGFYEYLIYIDILINIKPNDEKKQIFIFQQNLIY